MRSANAYLNPTTYEEQSMAYDIRLMKLVTGELVIGKYDQEKDCLNDVAAIQSIPTQQGVQMMMLPYGYPFEPNFSGTLSSTAMPIRPRNFRTSTSKPAPTSLWPVASARCSSAPVPCPAATAAA